MDNIQLLEAVERYMTGQMSLEERVHFEQLRKDSPEIDQLVVEHTFFIHQLTRHDELKRMKSRLNDIHVDLAQKGAIQSPKLKGKAKVAYLWNRYRRTAAIAASIAGITALTMSAFMWSLTSPVKRKSEIAYLSGQINAIKNQNKQQQQEINNVKNYIAAPPVASKPVYTTGGTGFLISTRGLLATNAHVIKGARQIAVQNSEQKDFNATVVYVDAARDLAILRIVDSNYKAPASLPYSIKHASGEIAEPVFTLGYPRNDIVYGEGYLAARTGFNGDTLTCQIAIAANPGNSGGPILNRNGEVIGVLSAKQISAEGVVFATQAKYIQDAINELQKKDTAFAHLKTPSSSSLKGLDRVQQVKKMADFVYMVKVN